MAKKALIVLAEGFEETEAVAVVDILRRAGVLVQVAGLSSTTVRGSHSIVIQADMLLSSAGEFDALILPGGMPGTKNLAASDQVIQLVRTTYSEGKLCAAICAAPSVLGSAGVLAGKRVTCYPGYEGALNGGKFEDRPVVVDGNIVTSRGVGTALAFSLELAALLQGRETAAKVGSGILTDALKGG